MRTVIAHYHTFKNSGTTFDEMLTEHFRDRHLLFDGPFPFMIIPQNELLKVIERHRDHRVFSSHQIRLPVPRSLRTRVLAAVFVRDPLLRVRSIYAFNRKRYSPAPEGGGDTPINEFQRWSVECDFGEWIERVRDHGSVPQISNAQVQAFGGIHGEPALYQKLRVDGTTAAVFSDFDQARRNLEVVPLLARTEHFGRDVEKFGPILAHHGFDFQPVDRDPANVSNPLHGESTEVRRAAIRKELGEARYAWLEEANRQDSALFEFVSAMLDD